MSITIINRHLDNLYIQLDQAVKKDHLDSIIEIRKEISMWLKFLKEREK